MWWLPSIKKGKTIYALEEISLIKEQKKLTIKRPSKCVFGELCIESFKNTEEDQILGWRSNLVKKTIS